FERVIYGDTPGNGLADAPGNDQTLKLNLRGRIYKHYDTAGLAISTGTDPATGADGAFDFKGNALRRARPWLLNYRNPPDWSKTHELDAETFSTTPRYHPPNRPIQLVAPHSNRPGATVNITRPGYNEAGLLEKIDVWLEQANEPNSLLAPSTATLH